MTKSELMQMVGENITVVFKDGEEATGKLGYTPEFSARYGFRRPSFFTLGKFDFKISHINRVKRNTSL